MKHQLLQWVPVAERAPGLHQAILVCSAFFLIAVVIVLFVNEERGKTVAREHAGE